MEMLLFVDKLCRRGRQKVKSLFNQYEILYIYMNKVKWRKNLKVRNVFKLKWNVYQKKYNKNEITKPIWYVGQDFDFILLVKISEKHFQMKLQFVYLDFSP